MKIVYMGTPAFACQPLLALHQSKHKVVAVVTGPAKRRGRRGDPCPTEVCCSAQELGLTVLTPKGLKSPRLHDQLAALEPDLFVVVAFRILPEKLFTLPRYGSINIHGSLLPRYRGAAPINWALINGEKETGLTSFFLNRQVDTGNIILQQKIAINDNENFDSLYGRMSEMSGQFLLRTLEQIEQPDFKPLPQDDLAATPAPKLTPEDGLIDFGLPALRVKDFVRGLSTKPAAYTFFRGRKLKVLSCSVVTAAPLRIEPPGSMQIESKRLLVRCAGSTVELTQVVPQGKNPMDGASFVNGFRPENGELLGELRKEVKNNK
ncbi:MAG: methionyl-tRNA formyltransferase [bacterium]